MDIQALMDAVSNAARDTRKYYHLTLGGLVSKLEKLPGDTRILTDQGESPGVFGSYRGYYADLAIEPGDGPVTAADLLDSARAALGSTFTGYNGGEFPMGGDTPLWIADHGCTGRAVVGMDGGTLVTKDVR